MELIFYDKAAELLGVTVDTLKQAVSRGELTRAGMQGTRQRLIKEQVLLFTGINPRTGKKKRISYETLTAQEQALWQRYADELHTTAQGAPAPPDFDRLITEKVQEAIARQELTRIQEEERLALLDAQARAHQKERYLKAYPFLERELAIA